MNHPSPGSPPGSGSAPAPHHSVWDRLLDDLHKRPRRYINGVLIVSLPVLIGILALQFWRTHRQEEIGTLATEWSDAWGAETNAKARASAIEGLGPRLKTEPQKALRLYELAVTYKELAEEATVHDEKVAYYEKMLAACSDLKANHTNSLWTKLPTRPPTSTGTPTLAAVDQLHDMAQRQLAWLKQHRFVAAVDADPNLKVTVELEDGRRFVIGKFFSRAAPYHVQSFIELARSGYFDGTGFSRLGQGFKKGSRPKQGDHPPSISIEGGHPMTKVTPDLRDDDDGQADIGYSVREEPNPLPLIRGSVTAVIDNTSGGDSPSRFKIYSDEPYYPQDTVFAEVTEGLEVVDGLVNALSADGNPTRPRDLVRIKKVTVEGSVLSPPEEPFPPAAKLPEGPKPESKPTSQPASRGAESQPESAPASRPESR